MANAKERVLANIELYLSERRESVRGGWAQITKGDMELLDKIIRGLVAAKCCKDADGDVPVEWTLVNRRTHERLGFIPVPYDFCDATPTSDEKLANEAKDLHHYNLRVAWGRFDQACRMVEHHQNDRERKSAVAQS
jgi:hypothetical protein